MTRLLRHFRQVWLVDFEFRQPRGERPAPVHCMVGREFYTGRKIRLWLGDLVAMAEPPFSIGPDSLFVAFFASAELNCFLSLGWPIPVRILDLFVEFRDLTNGLTTVCGNGLLGAMAHFGLGAIDAAEKDGMHTLARRGGPFSERERLALLDYCESDVVCLAKLLPVMLPMIDLPRALLRGRYMAAVARMEATGVPFDVATLNTLRGKWDATKGQLIREIDSDFGVFVPSGRRSINPNSRYGSAVLNKASEWDIDPHDLAVAADEVLAEDRQQNGEFRQAIWAARQATGLTTNRIHRWEDSGRDHSAWRGLDAKARKLAADLPALGLGRGYVTEETFDDTDYSARLWELLRTPDGRPKRKYDAEILEEAATRVAAVSDKIRNAKPLSFSASRFADWLIRRGIPWPRLDSGALALDDDTFRQMARTHPEVAPLRELRHSLGAMRLFSDLAVGSDCRNRCLLSPFQAVTGRNQPSNANFIFGTSCWLRGLIKPDAGRAVAYVDWSQQEFGIAAALSGDGVMQAAYLSADADPYLAFARQAGAVPADATKETHGKEREQFKICALAVQYGMGSQRLSQTLGQPEAMARELLRLHRQTYPVFWEWSKAAVDHAMLRGWLQTVFGWRVQVRPRANPLSLANFPMQGNGAEILRLACCLATERGIRVCAPVHDALLIEGPTEGIENVVDATKSAMAEASRVVLRGFELRSEATIVRYPNRYMDPRGERMWNTVMSIMGEIPEPELVSSHESF